MTPVSTRFTSLVRTALLGCVLLAPQALAAADHLVRPGSAVERPDGSSERPWPSVASALVAGAVNGGDRLLLMSGRHDPLRLRNQAFQPPLVIAAAEGAQPQVSKVHIERSSGIEIRGLHVEPAEYGKSIPPALVYADNKSQDITFAGLEIRGGPAAAEYLDWSADDWLARRFKGAQLNGRNIHLDDSRITAVTTGIGVQGMDVRVTDTEVRGFSKDGMRVLGSGAQVQGNLIRDCVKVDKNHDDGIQSWAGRGRAPEVVRDVVIDANRILEWTGPQDHPLRCKLQGIGLFDGPFENWTIRNNLILVSAHHGISLYKTSNSQIVNNSVLNAQLAVGKQPWIMLHETSRDGTNTLSNNIAAALRLGKDPNLRRWNLTVRNYAQLFESPQTFDFRPAVGSPLIGTADPGTAPDRDLSGKMRATTPALGALER